MRAQAPRAALRAQAAHAPLGLWGCLPGLASQPSWFICLCGCGAWGWACELTASQRTTNSTRPQLRACCLRLRRAGRKWLGVTCVHPQRGAGQGGIPPCALKHTLLPAPCDPRGCSAQALVPLVQTAATTAPFPCVPMQGPAWTRCRSGSSCGPWAGAAARGGHAGAVLRLVNGVPPGLYWGCNGNGGNCTGIMQVCRGDCTKAGVRA